ncbi:MAG: hypothetical protein LBG21_04090 [Campylobacteraceae bacterium]|jgi:ABC-type sulfate transport system permease subunit|nr:hypothetical protein [Campylobacteraceae bacterium]
MKQKIQMFKRVIFEIMTIPCVILMFVSTAISCVIIGVCYILLYPIKRWLSADERSKIANSSYAFKALVKARDFFNKAISK